MLKEGGSKSFKQTGGWLGITDKYWAAAIVPDQKAAYEAKLGGTKQGNREFFQADYLQAAMAVPQGGAGNPGSAERCSGTRRPLRSRSSSATRSGRTDSGRSPRLSGKRSS